MLLLSGSRSRHSLIGICDVWSAKWLCHGQALVRIKQQRGMRVSLQSLV